MTCDNWINLIAAILIGGGTLALAFMTWKSIRQNRDIQKSENRDRLLGEIFKWATDVANSAISRRTMRTDELWKTKLDYKYFRVVSKYISVVTSSSLNDLTPLVEDITKKLDKAIDTTKLVIDKHPGQKFIKNQADHDAIVDCENILRESVEELIKEVAKIKTKDTSSC